MDNGDVSLNLKEVQAFGRSAPVGKYQRDPQKKLLNFLPTHCQRSYIHISILKGGATTTTNSLNATTGEVKSKHHQPKFVQSEASSTPHTPHCRPN